MTTPDLRVAFFGHDALESTVVKRVVAMTGNGCAVIGLMFRRERVGLGARLMCPVINLGVTEDRSYLKRLPRLLGGTIRAVREGWTALRSADVIYARNVDMLAVAIAARALTGSRSVLAYEVLDIQRPFHKAGVVGWAFRATERLLLRGCDLLVVSAPDFISRYFGPVQGRYDGWQLLENKVPASLAGLNISPLGKSPGPPWSIGWFGTLRCRKSLQILCALSDALGDRVSIILGGRPSVSDLSAEELQAAAAARPNLTYIGAYASPQDLSALYGPMHFSWCVDYIDAGGNSDWLLPNRIYEGGLFGTVALARRETAVGRFVEQRALGFAFDEPLLANVSEMIRKLDAADYASAQVKVTRLPIETFVDTRDTADLVASLRQLAARGIGIGIVGRDAEALVRQRND